MSFEQNPKITTMRESQELVKFFAIRNGWKDIPNIDKFDHLHEELVEMSQHLRYKSEEERKNYVIENSEVFVDGIGDLFFGLCRLANQLGVDIEDAFNMVQIQILAKYNQTGDENNNVRSAKSSFKDENHKKPLDEDLCDVWNESNLGNELAMPEHMWVVCRVFSKYHIAVGNAQDVTTVEIGPFKIASNFKYSDSLRSFIKSIVPILIKDFCLGQPLNEGILEILVFAAELFSITLNSSCSIKDPLEWKVIMYVKERNNEGIQPTEKEILDFCCQDDINDSVGSQSKIKVAIENLKSRCPVVGTKKIEILALNPEGKYICSV